MLDIIEGEPLIGHEKDYDAIVVGTNCYLSLRNGFQREVAMAYPYVEEENMKTKYADPDKVGTIVECKRDGMPTFILAYITFGFNFKGGKTMYIDYYALEKCLKLINILYSGKSIATTMIGTTEFDGNGDKAKVLEILNKYSKGINITIFDYKQESHGKIHQKGYRRSLLEEKRKSKGVKKKRYRPKAILQQANRGIYGNAVREVSEPQVLADTVDSRLQPSD